MKTIFNKTAGIEASSPCGGAQYSTINYPKNAQALISEYSILTFEGKNYVYKNGVYREDKGTINSAITQLLLNCGLKGTASFTSPSQQIRCIISTSTVVDENPFNKRNDLLPVRNGVIKIDSNGKIELMDHSPEYRFTYQLPINFDSKVDKSAVIEYLTSTGCDVEILLQIPAHAMLSKRGMNFKKCYLLKGEKNSGKTVYLNLLAKRLFGKDNCSSLALDELANNTHASFGLVGKLVNICDELPRMKLYDLALFKRLTGGGVASINRKYCDPFEWDCDTTFIFAANYYPDVPNDPAFWERWILVDFNEAFKIDPTFEEKVFTEEFMSAFLNLVIERIIAIKKSGIKYDSWKLVREKWLHSSDPFYRYFCTSLVRDDEAFTVTADLYAHYNKHRETSEEMPYLTIEDFGRKMKAYGIEKGQRTSKGHKRQCHLGVKLKDA